MTWTLTPSRARLSSPRAGADNPGRADGQIDVAHLGGTASRATARAVTVDEILAQAVVIADAEGLHSLTIRRLATETNLGTMTKSDGGYSIVVPAARVNRPHSPTEDIDVTYGGNQ